MISFQYYVWNPFHFKHECRNATQNESLCSNDAGFSLIETLPYVLVYSYPFFFSKTWTAQMIIAFCKDLFNWRYKYMFNYFFTDFHFQLYSMRFLYIHQFQTRLVNLFSILLDHRKNFFKQKTSIILINSLHLGKIFF